MLTPQQIRAIAFIAVEIREELRTKVAATRWNVRGVEENIAKIASRSMHDATIGVARAAADPNAETPGVIPTAGPHWRAIDDDAPDVLPERYDPATTCGICGKPDWRCRQARGDHEFEPARTARRLDPESASAIVVELRDRIAKPTTTEPPTGGSLALRSNQ